MKLPKKYYYIYKTTNLVNGKIYIGKHTINNIDNSYIGSGVYFRKAVKKYGRENFSKEILEICVQCKHYLNLREKYWINEFKTIIPNGYNLTVGGDGVCFDGEFLKTRGETYSDSGNPNAKIVYQIDKINGSIIKEWSCIKEASEVLGIVPNGIAGSCKSNVKLYKDFIWRYKKDIDSFNIKEFYENVRERKIEIKSILSDNAKNNWNDIAIRNKINKRRNKITQSESYKVKHSKRMRGSHNPRAKSIINLDSGEVFGCMKDAWKSSCLEIKYVAFTVQISKNKLNYLVQ